jgi:hypothetical protein
VIHIQAAAMMAMPMERDVSLGYPAPKTITRQWYGIHVRAVPSSVSETATKCKAIKINRCNDIVKTWSLSVSKK